MLRNLEVCFTLKFTLTLLHMYGHNILHDVVLLWHANINIKVALLHVLCMDRGTENSKVAAVQYAFREFHLDSLSGDHSFRYGTSPANIIGLDQILYYF